MQTFETALVICLVLMVIDWALQRGGKVVPMLLTAAVLFTATVHVLTEGYRWQMIPVYGAAAGLLALTLARSYPPQRRRPILRALATIIMLLVIAAGATLSTVLPVFHVPAPDGPYKVGTLVYQLTDPNRDEAYTDEPNDKRELAIQVWYPAPADTDGPHMPWLDRADLFGPVMSKQVDLPSFFFNHVNLVTTNSIEAAPVAADGPFPVLIYSHGWTAFRGINTDEVENLASHGYVVIVPDHAYGAMLSVLPDGRAIYNLPSIVPDRATAGEAVYMASVQQLVDTYAGDIRFCIDKAAEWNDTGAASPFGGKLDLSKVGIFGHSTGGGAVAEVMVEDERVKAACAMDLWAVPVSDDVLEAEKRIPFLGMQSEIWSTEENSARLDRFWSAVQGERWYMSIAGTRHNDFTVVPLATPIAAQLGMKGPLEGKRVAEIVNTCLLDFFDHALKGESISVLGTGRFPEVTWKTASGS